MARLFDDATTEYLEAGSSPLSAYPSALAGWYYSDVTPLTQTILSVGDSGGGTYLAVRLGTNVNDSVEAVAVGTTTGAIAEGSTGYATNTWEHALATFATTADRRALINGAGKGTDTTEVGTTTYNRTRIGYTADNTPLAPFSGRLAECAAWDLSGWPGGTNAAKCDNFESFAGPALAAGFSPLFFPLGLVGYWPLGGYYSGDTDDTDIVGGTNLSPINTPSTESHPPALIFPSAPLPIPPLAPLSENLLSWLQFGAVTGWHTLPPVDGALGQDDRQHLLDSYAGVLFAAPGGVSLIAQARQKQRFIQSRIFSRVN